MAPLGACRGGLALAAIALSLVACASAVGTREIKTDMAWVHDVDLKTINWDHKGDDLDIQYTDLTDGTGRKAQHGDDVTVMYKFYWENIKIGKLHHVMSESTKRTAYNFVLGEKVYNLKHKYHKVNEGFDHALEGMQAGTRRVTIVPPNLGYGKKGVPSFNIPPDVSLVYFMEMLQVLPPEDQPHHADYKLPSGKDEL